jgi:hypothetical protein
VEASGRRPGAPLYHKAMWSAKGGPAIAGGTDAAAPRSRSDERELAVSARPDASKQDQAKPSKNAWICLVLFVRIGTFQWVTAEKIRKNPPSSLALCRMSQPLQSLSFSPQVIGHGMGSIRVRGGIALISGFGKQLRWFSVLRCAPTLRFQSVAGL